MNELALFAGVGGGLLATKWLLGWRTVCYVEWDEYCIKVLKARIRDGILDDAPIWDDARSFDGRPWAGLVDVVTAGFPCQPFSQAGKRRGEDDPRNMWPDTIRIIREVRPRFAFLENVPGLLSSGYYGTILSELAESGYDARWRVLSAAELGAPHKRDRVWIVAHATCAEAHSECERSQQPRRQQGESVGSGQETLRQANGSPSNDDPARLATILADTQGERCREEGRFRLRSPNGTSRSSEVLAEADPIRRDGRTGLSKTPEQAGRASAEGTNLWWQAEPRLGRMAHGVADWHDRVKAIGNGIVPAVAARVWRLLMMG